ncbi:cytochrome c peroxidase [uncultured Cocleimonas sp.]|uniref:cytochrome c peroxidase n=1 Tax=uncultured Cocleimonas sp. TaxID=1051587 RepID=UPI00262A3C98|nr:cytochrome c peroxidase [uncultured Cocleimonas sp.]
MKVFSVGVILFGCFLAMFETSATSLENNSTSKTIETIPLAPGFGSLGYKMAAAGSYKLPPLGDAADGKILDEQGREDTLHNIYKGKYTLLSFIYSNCKDVNGCPLASFVFYKLKTLMKKDPELADKLRLASLSFDPEHDSPEVMRLYGANFKFAGDKGEWRFLTTPSLAALDPILQSYNQDIQREMSVNGEETGDISHILRVFLVDPKLKVRNIYSLGFLHPEVILADIKTLILEDDAYKISSNDEPDQDHLAPILSVPGDDKDGYETGSYTTRSKSITARRGAKADLLALAKNPPLGLPAVPEPETNPLTAEKIELGRRLFFDRRLSFNDTFSCAICHIPEQGFANNELAMAIGIEGRSHRRNSPTLYNVAYNTSLFHDGREETLEQQIWGPLLAHNEMSNPSVGYVINKIKKMPDYKGLFEKAFDGGGVNMRNLGRALADYQRTLVSADSSFDRWYFGKQEDALSKKAQRGFQIFSGKGRCSTCHTISDKHALFTDQKMHNTGIGYNEAMGIKPAKERVVLAPGVFVDVDTAIIDSVGEKKAADTGLYEITQNPDDRWKYKTPSLRNVNLTAPYMHNGSLQTLNDVVSFYNKGGVANDLLDPLITPLNLSDQEQSDLVTFLQALTGSNVDTLVSDAFDAPIGDLTNSDPNWAHGRSEY